MSKAAVPPATVVAMRILVNSSTYQGLLEPFESSKLSCSDKIPSVGIGLSYIYTEKGLTHPAYRNSVLYSTSDDKWYIWGSQVVFHAEMRK